MRTAISEIKYGRLKLEREREKRPSPRDPFVLKYRKRKERGKKRNKV